MRRKIMVGISTLVLATTLVTGGVLAHSASASSPRDDATSVRAGRQFVGYWFGIDPLDGGDSRRGITPGDGGTFALVGRDTVFSLCDSTDRAIITGTARATGASLTSNDAVIKCFNTGAMVQVRLRYTFVDKDIIRELVTNPTGGFIDEIVFHRMAG